MNVMVRLTQAFASYRSFNIFFPLFSHLVLLLDVARSTALHKKPLSAKNY